MFTDEEFAEYVDLDVKDVNLRRVRSLSREAEVMIRAYADVPESVTDWPEAAKVVALRMVARGYLQADNNAPVGAESLSVSAGPFSQSYGFGDGAASGSLWFTRQDKELLRGRGGTRAYAVDLGHTMNSHPPDPWVTIWGG